MALKTEKKHLKKNWFVVSKMTTNWWILIQGLKSLKNLHFHWSRPVMSDLKKYWGGIFHNTRKWCKVKKIWLLVWKITWRIWEIFTRALESLKICPKFKLYELKIYWEVMCHDNEEWRKNWIGIDVSSKLIWGIWWILIRALENLKNLHFNGLPLTKVYNVWVKKVQRSYIWWH